MKKFIFVFGILLLSSCGQKEERKIDFIEARITRYAVLEHARETIVLRKIDKGWTAMLLDDGSIANCRYQKIVQPKISFEDLWQKLIDEGLLEIPESEYTTNCCTDGHGYEVKLFYQGKLKHFSFHIPEKIPIKEAKQIQNIGDTISQNFEIPDVLCGL